MNRQAISTLPIFPHLEKICDELKSSPTRFLILTAETAAGKSTAVPLALVEKFQGKILMLEPRRLATIAVAERCSELLGETPGKTIGYSVHLESKKSKETRVEIITEAILTRRLQNDPLLEDVNVVVLDEFHERSVHTDLALSFLKETLSLRDDLYVLIMSATIETASLVDFCGELTPVIKVPGRQFPVETKYITERSLVSVITEEISRKKHKSILVFLPGMFEITRTKSDLEEIAFEDVEVLVLHSSIPLSEQKKILRPNTGDNIRVILSTSIAETSITVPDVTLVIDSGLARISKMDYALGMSRLVTEKVSQFSAQQRSGRAGRIQPGECIRLWDKNELRAVSVLPEIHRSDLSQLVLECAKWGCIDHKKMKWLDEPNDAAWNTSLQLLEKLNFIEKGRITVKGEMALGLGMNPRFASCAIFGKENGVLDVTLRTLVKYSEYGEKNTYIRQFYIQDIQQRMENLKIEEKKCQVSSGEILLAGFPDRIALKCAQGHDMAEYQFPSGRKAVLRNAVNSSRWIVVPNVDAGNSCGKIHSWENLDDDLAEKWLSSRTQNKEIVEFEDGNSFKLIKKNVICYDQLAISEKKSVASSEDFSKAVCDSVEKNGLKWLPLGKRTEDFLLRCEFYGIYVDEKMLEKLKGLTKNAGEWLSSFVRSKDDFVEKNVFQALYWYLQGNIVDEKVPEQIQLANGLKRKISYEKHASNEKVEIKPVLEIIIQHIFGVTETPKICSQTVLLKLLSPARRPLQITEDLKNFWSTSWIEICKEMKGRYPKHNWDHTLFKD